MCQERMPVKLGLLHALRLAAEDSGFGTDYQRAWLALAGTAAASTAVRDLGAVLARKPGQPPCLAPPGETAIWPHEEALLEALGRIYCAPEQAEELLGFLPDRRRVEVMHLLADLAEQLRVCATQRLRHDARRLPAPIDATSPERSHPSEM